MNLFDLPPTDALRELDAWLEGKEPAYRVRQVLPRLWNQPVATWADATDLPAALRASLEATYPIPG